MVQFVHKKCKKAKLYRLMVNVISEGDAENIS